MNVYLGDTTSKIVSTTANVVKKLIESGKKCVVFSEDKITLSLELEIASRLGGGFFDVDVIIAYNNCQTRGNLLYFNIIFLTFEDILTIFHVFVFTYLKICAKIYTL